MIFLRYLTEQWADAGQLNLFRSLSSTIRTTVLRFYLLNKCVNDKRGLKFPSRCLEQKFERDRNKSRFKLKRLFRNQKSYCSKLFFKILFARRQDFSHTIWNMPYFEIPWNFSFLWQITDTTAIWIWKKSSLRIWNILYLCRCTVSKKV